MKSFLAALLVGTMLLPVSLIADDDLEVIDLDAVDFGPMMKVNVEGTWDISQSALLDGTRYGGTVTITEQEGIYTVEWTTESSSYSGIGLRYGNDLYVGWGPNSGIAVYDIAENGALSGVWTSPGMEGTVGSERLSPMQNAVELPGLYTVTGTNADGSQYTGSITIEQNGEVYQVAWGGSAGSATGVGIRVGDRLLVGFGAEHGLNGIMHYHFAEEAANGRWTYDDADATGTENLVRGTR